MAFCKFCGAEIPDGGVCNCQGASNSMNNGSPYGTPDPSYNPYAGDQGGAAAGGGQSPVDKIKKLAIPIGAGVIALILIIVLFSVLFGGGYKTPIKDVVKGFNKNNTEMIAKAVLDKDTIEDLEDDGFDDMDIDGWDDLDEKFEDLKGFLENGFGDDVKLKVEFLDKKEAKNKEIDALEDMYEEMDMDVDIKKAYKVKLKLTIKGDDDDMDAKITVFSVKLKGEGWKVMITEDSLTSLLPAGQKLMKKLDLDMYSLEDQLEDILDF